MRIFLDTSSLIKLYHFEEGTIELDDFFESHTINEIFISSLAKLEFNSALWKKVRTRELTEDETFAIIASFEKDYQNYTFIEVTNELISRAKGLIYKYGSVGLRTLDSIQLASIVKIKSNLDFAHTSDDLLMSFIGLEGIKNNISGS